MVAQVQRFLSRRAFYPLLLCTILCFTLLVTRFYVTGEARYRFLVWNLFLAWMPYWCSVAAVWVRQHARDSGSIPRKWQLTMIGAAWLVMFPNAPYIFTDFIHVIHNPTTGWWYDVGMISCFAMTGCFIGVVSLRIMHDLVRAWSGELLGWTFVLGAAILSGFGIYLGRFQRFNSWDVLLRPRAVFGDVLSRIVDPFSHQRTIGVTLMFAAIVLASYIMFRFGNLQAEDVADRVARGPLRS